MNPKIDYTLDDIGQIYFTPLQNLTYELIQADKSFGFGNTTIINPTTGEIDLAITTREQILESNRNKLFDALNSDQNLTKFNLTCDGKMIEGNGFGFENLAIMIDQNSIWLLIKQVDKIQSELIGAVIEKISKEFTLFLVDKAQGSIIDSRLKSEFIKYLDAED